MFSERLIEAINRKGVSRYRIAKDTKITEATLSNYFNGKVRPSRSIVKQLAEYLGVDYYWLLNGEVRLDTVSDPDGNPSAEKTSGRKTKYNKSDQNGVIRLLESRLKELENQLKKKDEQIDHLIRILESKFGMNAEDLKS